MLRWRDFFEIFVHIDFIEFANIMLSEIYRDRMIIIIKRSLYGVTLCETWFKIFIWENICITRKAKITKTRIYLRHDWVWLIKEWKCIWLTSYRHIQNVLFWNFLVSFIVYIAVKLMTPSCLASRARNLVLFCFYFSTTEDFYYNQWKIQLIVSLWLRYLIWWIYKKVPYWGAESSVKTSEAELTYQTIRGPVQAVLFAVTVSEDC